MKLPFLTGTGPVTGDNQSLAGGSYFLFANGAGSFRIETMMHDGSWQFSDDTTFSSPCNQVIELPAGAYRIGIVTGTLAVELRG